MQGARNLVERHCQDVPFIPEHGPGSHFEGAACAQDPGWHPDEESRLFPGIDLGVLGCPWCGPRIPMVNLISAAGILAHRHSQGRTQRRGKHFYADVSAGDCLQAFRERCPTAATPRTRCWRLSVLRLCRRAPFPLEVFHCRPQCHVGLRKHAWICHEGAK